MSFTGGSSWCKTWLVLYRTLSKSFYSIKRRWICAQLINAKFYCKSKNNKILSVQQSHIMYAALNIHIYSFCLLFILLLYLTVLVFLLPCGERIKHSLPWSRPLQLQSVLFLLELDYKMFLFSRRLAIYDGNWIHPSLHFNLPVLWVW